MIVNLRATADYVCLTLDIPSVSFTAKTDPEKPEQVTDQTRKLGLVVVRGTQVSLVSPKDGMEEIANPFGIAEEEEEEG